MTGIHDIPAREYHAIEAASASKLRRLWQSTPAHFKADMDTPKDSPALRLGSLAHSLILEPEKPLGGIAVPPEEYAPGKPWNYNAKVCKQWRNKQKDAGNEVITADEYATLQGVLRSVAAHPFARATLEAGRAEVSCIVTADTEGVPVKCRIDFVPDAGDFLVDLKTAQSAEPREFERAAYSHGYHIQAALYLAVWNTLAGADNPKTGFRFIVVEKAAPYAVNVFEASPEFLEKGRRDFATSLATYAKCVRENRWPAYPIQIQSLGLPSYAK